MNFSEAIANAKLTTDKKSEPPVGKLRGAKRLFDFFLL